MKLTHKKTENHHVNLNTRAILTFFQQIISFIYGKTSAAVELIFATLQGSMALACQDMYDVEIDDENVPLDYLMKIIQELPDQYRLVFSLYVLDGYSHKEIAEMLKITTGTTKSNLSRARLILKEKIEAYTKTELKSLVK